jgi:hypothetical protein
MKTRDETIIIYTLCKRVFSSLCVFKEIRRIGFEISRAPLRSNIEDDYR